MEPDRLADPVPLGTEIVIDNSLQKVKQHLFQRIGDRSAKPTLPFHKSISTKAAHREEWLDKQSPRIKALVEQRYGKENIQQCFRSQAALRHVLLPLWKSGFLKDDTESWLKLVAAFPFVDTFLELINDTYGLDFSDLCGFRHDDFESDTKVDPL